MHLTNLLWAYQSSPKFALRFSPFSFVYEIEAITLVELMIPSPKGMQMQKKDKEKEVFVT